METLQERLQREIDPHNCKAGDVHTDLFNAVTHTQLAITEEEMYSSRIEVFNAVKDIISHTIAETLKAAVSAIEGEKRNQDAPKESDPHFTGCGGCGGQYPAICGCREVNKALSVAITAVEGLGKTDKTIEI